MTSDDKQFRIDQGRAIAEKLRAKANDGTSGTPRDVARLLKAADLHANAADKLATGRK